VTDNFAKLLIVIQTSVKNDPCDFNGSLWCRLSHRERAEAVGCDEKTIQRLVRRLPLVWDRTRIDGEQVCLVRIGEKTAADVLRINAKSIAKLFNDWLKEHTPKDRARLTKERAKILELVFVATGEELIAIKERLKRLNYTLRMLKPRLPDKDFGLCVELARRWPDNLHVALMKLVLSRWGDFMGRVKVVQANQLAHGASILPRYYQFPFLIAILNYADVAVDMMEEDYMMAGKAPPISLKNVHPHLWHHLTQQHGKKLNAIPF
jgi:hypothetical protein